jgi:ribonuclease E
LTTIDVNSGSFIKSNNTRATSFWTNYMAVLEIINQIKIRNIGGIIIIDFIDSANQEDQIQILTHLSYKLKYEIIPTKIIQMSELGLVELTRARQGQNIYDALSKRCMACEGLGYKSKFNTNEVKGNFELLAQLIPVFSNAISK